jgi:ribokinase
VREANSNEERSAKTINDSLNDSLDQNPTNASRGRLKRADTIAKSNKGELTNSSNGQSPGRLLSVIGAINWDISIFEDRFARPGEEVPVRLVEEYSGGKGANVAVAAARILGPRRVAFLGALGDDYLWSRQLAELKKEGVITDGMVRVERSRSGRAYILIDADGRKTIHTHFGANDRISSHHLIRGVAASFLSKTQIMIVMDPPTPVALTAAESAGSKGAKVIYSPGVRTQEGRQRLERVLEHSNYLVVDRVELMNMYQTHSEEEAIEEVKQTHSS